MLRGGEARICALAAARNRNVTAAPPKRAGAFNVSRWFDVSPRFDANPNVAQTVHEVIQRWRTLRA
jgi:hypothetical protein